MGSSSIPDAPAERPERVVEVKPEDIEIGTSAQTQGTDLRTSGKRSLTKPSGGASSGLRV